MAGELPHNWPELFGLTRAPEESWKDFQYRAAVTLTLMSPRPVTLRDYIECAEAFAGRGAVVTGREVGERRVELTVLLPWYRRLFAWQRKRVRRRVWEKVTEAREINFIVLVDVP